MTFFSRLCLSWLKKTQSAHKRQSKSGFTLLELIITLLIASFLGAVLYPATLNQIGKARVAEARNGLGAINRAQQTHLVEFGEFAQTMEDLYVQFTLGEYQEGDYVTKYYVFSVEGTPNPNEVHHQATPIRGENYNTRIVASAVFHNPTFFETVICEASLPSGIPDIVDRNTCNDGRFIR